MNRKIYQPVVRFIGSFSVFSEFLGFFADYFSPITEFFSFCLSTKHVNKDAPNIAERIFYELCIRRVSANKGSKKQ